MKIARIGLVLSLLLVAVPVVADQLAVGAEVPPLTLNDQYDQPLSISKDTRLLLFAVDKPAADLLNAFLERQSPDYLDENGGVYLLDISGMPRLITQMFALPKMRKRPYRILLARESGTVAFLPRRQNAATVITLDNGVVKGVHFVADEAGLKALF